MYLSLCLEIIISSWNSKFGKELSSHIMDKVFLLLITLRSIDIDIDSVPIYILLASSSHQPDCDLNLTIDSRVLLFLLFFSSGIFAKQGLCGFRTLWRYFKKIINAREKDLFSSHRQKIRSVFIIRLSCNKPCLCIIGSYFAWLVSFRIIVKCLC